jgi:hypothetical protein
MCLVLSNAITQVTLKFFGDPDSILLVWHYRADVQRVSVGDNDPVISLIALYLWRGSSTQSNRCPDEGVGSQVRGQFVPCTTRGLLAESIETILISNGYRGNSRRVNCEWRSAWKGDVD